MTTDVTTAATCTQCSWRVSTAEGFSSAQVNARAEKHVKTDGHTVNVESRAVA